MALCCVGLGFVGFGLDEASLGFVYACKHAREAHYAPAVDRELVGVVVPIVESVRKLRLQVLPEVALPRVEMDLLCFCVC